MSLLDVLRFLWEVLNTPAGITATAGVFLWAINRVYAAKPAWAGFEGSIITAIRIAEKEIPDGSQNVGLHRLDRALQYVIKAYEHARGRPPSARVKDELREGIQVLHHELETDGALK